MQRWSTRAMAATTALVLCAGLRGQVPPESVPAGTRVVQQPLSGRAGQQGGVATVQSTAPGGLQSVNTIISTVQVQGAYQGSVPSAQAPGAPLTLTLDEA